ncbi:MAG: aspartate aminotransferase [Planctomycetota bacterium]|jgi:aspartate aminotransferase
MTGLAPNARSHLIEASATLAISATAAQLKAAGQDVVSLGAGEPDFPTPGPIAQAGIEAIEQGNYRYTAAAGTPALRQAGAEWLTSAFGLEYDKSEVMVSAGAKAALHMAMASIVEPGDAVLLLAPYWVSYPALVTLAGGTPVIVEANPDRGFVHDTATIEAAAKKHNAKGIIANFPNNPSGAVPSHDDVKALVDLCTRNDMWIVSDEIYSTLLYDDAKHVSPASMPGGRERTIVVAGFTKSHTLTGWRTSFMAAPKDIIDTAARLQSQVLGNPCTISQAAMLKACQLPLPEEHERRMAAFTERRNFLVEALNKVPGVSLATPRGSFYALIDIRPICKARGITDIDACTQLLEQHYLALVPGSAFGIPGFVRASYAADMDTLNKAVERITAWANNS